MKGIINCSNNLQMVFTDESKNKFFTNIGSNKSVINSNLTLEFSGNVENYFSFSFNGKQNICKLIINQNGDTFDFNIEDGLDNKDENKDIKLTINKNKIEKQVLMKNNITTKFNMLHFTLTRQNNEKIHILLYSNKPDKTISEEIIQKFFPCIKPTYNQNTHFILEIYTEQDKYKYELSKLTEDMQTN